MYSEEHFSHTTEYKMDSTKNCSDETNVMYTPLLSRNSVTYTNELYLILFLLKKVVEQEFIQK